MYVVESIPTPDAAVVWGRIVMRVRRADFLPVHDEFYDERGTLVRVMTFSDIKTLSGRTIPTRWEMRPTARPGNVTTIVMTRAIYDQPIASDVFTQRTSRNGDAQAQRYQARAKRVNGTDVAAR